MYPGSLSLHGAEACATLAGYLESRKYVMRYGLRIAGVHRLDSWLSECNILLVETIINGARQL